MGALGTRHSPAPSSFLGGRFNDSGASRRGNAELCRYPPPVIVRHRVGASRRPMTGSSGRSSIPETLENKSKSRSVLDRPVKPDDDGSLWRSETAKQSISVVPANAGTHNHRSPLEQKALATVPKT